MKNQCGRVVSRNLVDLMCIWKMDFMKMGSILDLPAKVIASWYMRDIPAELSFEQLDRVAKFFGVPVMSLFTPRAFNAQHLPDVLGYGVLKGRIYTHPNEASQSRA